MFCPRCGTAVQSEHGICEECSFNLALLDDGDDQHCGRCTRSLSNRPAIEIDDHRARGVYCYACAKKVVSEIENALATTANAIFAEESAEYARLRNTYENWQRRRDEFRAATKKQRLTWALGIAISLGLFGAWPFAILLLFMFFVFFFELSQGDYVAFERISPQPPWPYRPTLEHPTIPHRPVQPSSATFTEMSRIQILGRDQYRCQWCGTSGSQDDFEVHHVLPLANKGTDDPGNLVTLCIECHKKEDWYGHVHKYAGDPSYRARRTKAISETVQLEANDSVPEVLDLAESKAGEPEQTPEAPLKATRIRSRPEMKSIIKCPKCEQKLSVPSERLLDVTCAKCGWKLRKFT